MSKQFKILDKSAIVEEEQLANFDWNLCVICQKSTSEKLQSPVEATKRPAELCAGCLTFEESIKRCKALNWFPVKLNLEILTDDTDHGTADILQKRKAKWHKSCRMKFSDLKLERQEKRKRSGDSIDESCRPTAEVKVTRQSCTASTKTMTSECFFCDEASGDLHQASTFNIDRRVRECAFELQDTVLLAKLSAGDLISLEAVYHVNCLVALYNRARKRIPNFEEEKLDEMYNGIVFAELVSFIEESRLETNIAPVFKLADLTKLYTSRLEQLISTSKESVKCNQTHLKNRILSVFPELQAHRQGREVLLIFSTDVGDAIKQATNKNYDDEGMILAKAASIVRRDMFQTKYKFSGTFEYNYQQSSVPESLKSLIRMIFGGPDIETQSSNSIDAQTTLTISQLLQFNCTIRRRKDSQSTFHSSDREPPLPIYLGLMIHAETRKRGLIDKLYSLGLCISYDRIMHLSTALGNSICDRFNADNTVCPVKLKRGVITTAAVDNIDHNPSSNTSQGSLHGTAISLFQHPTLDNKGEERFSTAIDDTFKGNILKPLPESYAIVPPVTLPKEPAEVPVLGGKFISDCEEFPSDMNLEYRWLNYVKGKISGDDFEDLNISWAVFHAIRLQSDVNKPFDICSLLPLFQEEAKSIVMLWHSMTIVMQCVHFLNHGQKAVIACDQPLYALAKTMQWNWPDRFGESHITVMFGGLHIEIAAFRTIGDWLQNNGWVNALSEANIASSGTADSFLKASHVSRTRHAHQITACVLHILMNRAYITYIEENDLDVGTVTFDDWKAEREIESPQFHFWSITLKLELTILSFVRSLREGNFQMYKDSLTKIVPWFFALDHPNYARWIPVHLRDMMCLTETSPGVASEFEAGHFVVNKTSNLLSSIAIDHAHEQNNKLVKGDGGAIGLTENMSQLLRWMVSGPEMARVVNEFESSQELLKHIQAKGPNIRHHEQVNSIQKTSHNQVKSLIQVFEEMGNPFLESSEDLLVLDTRDISDPRVTETVRHIERIGKEQFQEFVSERLEKQIKPLAIPIKQNKFPLFSRQELRTESIEKQQINSLKQNISLFPNCMYHAKYVTEIWMTSFVMKTSLIHHPSHSLAS